VTSLFSFEGVNGSEPGAALIQGRDGNFYGTTSAGGIGYDGLDWSGNGTVFRLAGAFTAEAPLIVTQPANQIVAVGGTATFSVVAASATPLTYGWQRNGVTIAGATLSSYQTNNVPLADSGSVFSCLVSNAYGSVATSNATLTVVVGTPGLITFDELIGTDLPVPAGYFGLTWSNFEYLNGVAYGQPSGFGAGVVSTNNVAFNNEGAPAAMSDAAPFNLLSAYLTAAWDDNLQVEVQGYNGPELIYDNTYTLSATAPTLIAFNYVGVTSVQFISSGGTPHPGYGGSGSEFVMDNVTVVVPVTTLAPPPPPPLPMAMLYSFDGFDGGAPASALVQGLDGNFYGTTEYGGTYGSGTVFRLTANGTLSTLFSFDNIHGAEPSGALAQGTDGYFYGTTTAGGADGQGTVFSLSTNGTLSTLVSFAGANGAEPDGGLVQYAGGYFYGTTTAGGVYGQGTVFSLSTNGALSTLVSFDGTNGAYPNGGLVQGAEGYFYGATQYGGTNDQGTLFSLTTNGALSTLASFNDEVTGAYPAGALVQGADGNLYGSTEYGGTNGEGTVFSLSTNGTLTTLVSFANFNGAAPCGALVQGADGNFYGATEYGGADGDGTVFVVTTNGVLTSLFSFAGADGLYPQAGLVLGSDGAFYGTAAYGGVGFSGASLSGDGILFRLGAAPVATPPAIIAQPVSQMVPVNGAAFFSVNAGGAAPLSYSWQRNGSAIAGATQSAYTTNNILLTASGSQFSCLISNAYGSVISSNAALNVFNVSGSLFSFNGPDGGYPAAALLQGADGRFYGTTEYGGTYGNGTVFSLTTNGIVETLASFNLTNGAQPSGALVQGADGRFYGTTEGGGTYQYGTVFSLTTNGALTTLVSFAGVNGAYPQGALLQGADGNFYGTTPEGGTNDNGTVFSLSTNGALTTLVSFAGANGAEPYGALLQGADGNFYGTTEEGGTNGYGTVFSLTTNGAVTTLVSFDGANGAYPQGGLVQGADGYFYGTTTEGGAYGDGTLFSLTTNSAMFSLATNGTVSSFYSFEGSNGINPQGSLIRGADGNLYGTTAEGGTYGNGTVFSLTINGTVTSLFSFEGVNGSYPGAALTQGSDGNFYGTTASGGVGYDGLYWSGNGTVFRLAGAFTAEAPLIVTQPANQIVAVGGTATFSVVAASATPLTYGWQRNGVTIAGATLSSYQTNNVPLADSGSVFSCLVSNAYGSVATSNATLTVVVGTPGLITFDELIGTDLPVPAGYFGLTWSNFELSQRPGLWPAQRLWRRCGLDQQCGFQQRGRACVHERCGAVQPSLGLSDGGLG
jgi:uncharacterized repeat protein (TIGR03803 family)